MEINRTRPEQVHKIYDLKEASLEDNVIKGMASVYGNVDRSGDVIFPGFFKSAIKGFKGNGFVAVGHDWSGLPVAMPTEVKELKNGLYCEAEFHSTQEAQNARTVCAERMEKGLSVGLSVGFRLSSEEGAYAYFEDGKSLMKYAVDNGYDEMSFDPSIKSRKRGVWALFKCGELYEYSIVTIPANPKATASEVKSVNDIPGTEREFEDFLRDAGYSRKEATAITLHGFKALRDAVAKDTDDTPSQEDVIRQYELLSLRTRSLSL